MTELTNERLHEIINFQAGIISSEIKAMAFELLVLRFEANLSDHDKQFHREMRERAKNGENID